MKGGNPGLVLVHYTRGMQAMRMWSLLSRQR